MVPAVLSGTVRRVRIDRAVEGSGQADNEPGRGSTVDNGREANEILGMFAPPNEDDDNAHLFEPKKEQKDPLLLLSDVFTKATIRFGDRNSKLLLSTMRSVSHMLSTVVSRFSDIVKMRNRRSATLMTALKRNKFEK